MICNRKKQAGSAIDRCYAINGKSKLDPRLTGVKQLADAIEKVSVIGKSKHDLRLVRNQKTRSEKADPRLTDVKDAIGKSKRDLRLVRNQKTRSEKVTRVGSAQEPPLDTTFETI